MAIAKELGDLLICPESGAPLVVAEGGLTPDNGQTLYPVVQGVPWLLPNPSGTLADWSAKLNHFNQSLLQDIKVLEQELSSAQGGGKQRLERLIKGKQNFIRRVSELLLPVVTAKAAAKKVYDSLRDRAPSTQNLLSYEANLYRDWVWGDEENALTANIVCQQIGDLQNKKLVVLGAGAGRLALDIHNTLAPDITVATDINPLLVMAAQHLLSGESLELYEFPLHPRNSESVAVEHRIDGINRPENFHYVFSDVNHPTFQPGAFDLAVTPWLIDIQPLALSHFLQQLNAYLPIGGQWVNFGSLVFNQRRDVLCHSIEEVEALAKAQGFAISNIQEHEIPYLKSPYNAGYRQERVWSWRAEKIADVKQIKSPQAQPYWLRDDKQAIPSAPYFQQFSFTHRVYSQLASAVDGKTSLNKIARKFAKQNGVDEAEALQMVKNFFADLYQQNN